MKRDKAQQRQRRSPASDPGYAGRKLGEKLRKRTCDFGERTGSTDDTKGLADGEVGLS